MGPAHDDQGRLGDYPNTWDPLPQPAPELSVDNSNSNSTNMDRVDGGSDPDVTASVDLDGFNVLPFDDAGNLPIDYEPFGLLLDGI